MSKFISFIDRNPNIALAICFTLVLVSESLVDYIYLLAVNFYEFIG